MPSSQSLVLFPAGFEVQRLDPYAFETHFTAMQTKESGLQAACCVAVNQQSLSLSLTLTNLIFSTFLSPHHQWEKAD